MVREANGEATRQRLPTETALKLLARWGRGVVRAQSPSVVGQDGATQSGTEQSLPSLLWSDSCSSQQAPSAQPAPRFALLLTWCPRPGLPPTSLPSELHQAPQASSLPRWEQ